MPREQLIAAVDIGATKVCALLAEVSASGEFGVLGVGVCSSGGVHNGVVANMSATVEAISAAVGEVEASCRRHMPAAYVSISGSHIYSQNSRGLTTLDRNGQIVRPVDIQRVLDSAAEAAVPADHEVIHVVPCGYSIDGQDGIQDSLGMAGRQLEVEAHVVSGPISSVQNLARCVQQSGVKLEHLVLQSVASAEATTTESERQVGVVVIDIGGRTTDVAIYLDGALRHTFVVPLGGRSVTSDITKLLHLSVSEAERLKITFGHALPQSVRDLALVRVPGFERSEEQRVCREHLAEIVAARLDQILSMVAEELDQRECLDLLGAGAVITGGVADQRGLRELAEDVLAMPVRTGQPQGVDRLGKHLAAPAFATGVGLLLWGSRRIRLQSRQATASRLPGGASSWGEHIRRFFRAFFP